MLGDLGKLIVAIGFKSCPKSNKSPNLVTLLTNYIGQQSDTAPNWRHCESPGANVNLILAKHSYAMLTTSTLIG